MRVNQDLIDLLRAFSDHGVEFLVVGAHALAAHGHVRATKDLDVWVRPSRENAARTYKALAAFGVPRFERRVAEPPTDGSADRAMSCATKAGANPARDADTFRTAAARGLGESANMDHLPQSLPVLDHSLRTTSAGAWRRVAPTELNFSEADWDRVLMEQVDALSDALAAAEVIGDGARLRVLRDQVDSVDILMAEVGDDDAATFRRLVLVEDKLLKNATKRSVLAQIAEYSERARTTWLFEELRGKLPAHRDWQRAVSRVNVGLRARRGALVGSARRQRGPVSTA